MDASMLAVFDSLRRFELHIITVMEGFVCVCKRCGKDVADCDAIRLDELATRALQHQCGITEGG